MPRLVVRSGGRVTQADSLMEPTAGPLPASPVGPPAGPPLDQVGRRPVDRADATVRPKLILLAAVVVGPMAVFWWLARLMLDSGSVDPRLPICVLSWLMGAVIACTSRLVVADRALRRRSLLGGRVVSLDQLAQVTIRKARWTRKEGWGGQVVELVDRYGRTMRWKPWCWARRSLPVLAIIGACVRSQRLDVDEATANQLSPASLSGSDVPPWTFRGTPTIDGLLAPSSVAAEATRPTGRRRTTRTAVAVSAVMFLVAGGFTYVATRLGTAYVQQARCAPNRHRWTTDADVAGNIKDPVAEAARLTTSNLSGLDPATQVLSPDDLLYASPASFADGRRVTWGPPDNPPLAIRIEQFTSHQAALDYNRAWGEWHCRQPEASSPLDIVPGAAAFRYTTKNAYEDKASFVRGDTRIEIIAWTDKSDKRGDRLAAAAGFTALP
jgi:hypothetical protein